MPTAADVGEATDRKIQPFNVRRVLLLHDGHRGSSKGKAVFERVSCTLFLFSIPSSGGGLHLRKLSGNREKRPPLV